MHWIGSGWRDVAEQTWQKETQFKNSSQKGDSNLLEQRQKAQFSPQKIGEQKISKLSNLKNFWQKFAVQKNNSCLRFCPWNLMTTFLKPISFVKGPLLRNFVFLLEHQIPPVVTLSCLLQSFLRMETIIFFSARNGTSFCEEITPKSVVKDTSRCYIWWNFGWFFSDSYLVGELSYSLQPVVVRDQW